MLYNCKRINLKDWNYYQNYYSL